MLDYAHTAVRNKTNIQSFLEPLSTHKTLKFAKISDDPMRAAFGQPPFTNEWRNKQTFGMGTFVNSNTFIIRFFV